MKIHVNFAITVCALDNLLDDPLYPVPLVPCEPDFGRAHDLVLQRFGQQRPPMVEHSLSCKHFGVHDAICDDNGHSPKSIDD